MENAKSQLPLVAQEDKFVSWEDAKFQFVATQVMLTSMVYAKRLIIPRDALTDGCSLMVVAHVEILLHLVAVLDKSELMADVVKSTCQSLAEEDTLNTEVNVLDKIQTRNVLTDGSPNLESVTNAIQSSPRSAHLDNTMYLVNAESQALAQEITFVLTVSVVNAILVQILADIHLLKFMENV
jgi:hypothetical protein